MALPTTTPSLRGVPHENGPARRDEVRPPRPSAPSTMPGPVPAAPVPRLVEVLRCPLTGGTLIPVDADRLMSDRPFRDGVHPVYPVSNGIPCLRPVR